jgi:signal peptidase I
MPPALPEPLALPVPRAPSAPPTPPTPREPWLAVMLSSVFPGLGHAYLGRRAMSAAIATGMIALSALIWWGIVSESGQIVLAIAAGVAAFALALWAAVDAHHRARDSNDPAFEAARRQQPDPWKAAWLSRLLPGLGHLYLRKPLFGIALFIGCSVITAAARPEWLSDLLGGMAGVAAVALAYSAAPARRETSRRWLIVVASLLAAQVLVGSVSKLYFRSHVVQAFRIPSSSMEPTLRPGDCVFVSRRDGYVPRRGDLMVYGATSDPRQILIKRIVAMPGDTVFIRDKVLWVNGVRQSEPYVVHADSTIHPATDDRRDNLESFVVPTESWFVLGDNRDNSNDSRFHGPVPRALVLGRAYRIYWPIERSGPVR